MSFKLTHSTLRRRVAMLFGAAMIATAGLAGSTAGTAQAEQPEYCMYAGEPDTPVNEAYSMEASECAVVQLINEQRAAQGLPELQPEEQRLGNAARGHARLAVNLKWWCEEPEAKSNPLECDSHIEPSQRGLPGNLEEKRGAAIAERTRAAGYCPNATEYHVGENTYTAAATPREAVTWWMNHAPPAENGHRKNILSSTFTDVGVGIELGSAIHGNNGPAATFVVDFGQCRN